MHGCSFRSCTPGDEHALALVGQATFLETFAGVLDGADILAHCHTQHTAAVYAAWLGERAGLLWLAETTAGLAPIGYFGLRAAELPAPDVRETDIELKRIYVLKRFQGTGVGDALMDRAITTARDFGKTRLLLGVYALNERAIAFYQRRGFQPVATRRFPVGHNTYEDTVFALPL